MKSNVDEDGGDSRMGGNGPAAKGWLYWVLPAAFVLHDAEELATMPAWIAAHRNHLETLLAGVGAADAAAALPTTFVQVGIAIGCILIVFVVVTAGVWSRPLSRLWRTVYGGLLGAFFLHAFTHVLQGVVFGGYTPGVVTAVVIVAPAAAFVYGALTRRGALDRGPTAVATVFVLLLFVPAVMLAFSVAAWLAPS